MNIDDYEKAKNLGKLQGQIDFLVNSLSELQGTVERLETENHFLKKRFKALQSTVTALESSIQENPDAQ